MLNTIEKKTEVHKIKVAEVTPTTEEKFEALTESKRIKVNITKDEKTQRFRLRYTLDGKRKEVLIRYGECGEAAGLEKAEKTRKELEEKLNKKEEPEEQ